MTPPTTGVESSERDWRYLDFAFRWAPHGGGPVAEIYQNFGIGAADYFTEVIALLTVDQDPPMPRTTIGASIDTVLSVARRRVWLHS